MLQFWITLVVLGIVSIGSGALIFTGIGAAVPIIIMGLWQVVFFGDELYKRMSDIVDPRVWNYLFSERRWIWGAFLVRFSAFVLYIVFVLMGWVVAGLIIVVVVFLIDVINLVMINRILR